MDLLIKTLANDRSCFESIVDSVQIESYFQPIHASRMPLKGSLKVYVNGAELPESNYRLKYSRQIIITPQPTFDDTVRLEYRCSSL